MIVDEGCFERGCACHDSRESPGVVVNPVICEHGSPEADGACKECYLMQSQNTEQDRVLVEMEHALNEADAIMEEVSEETADAWRKRWGRLWGRKV